MDGIDQAPAHVVVAAILQQVAERLDRARRVGDPLARDVRRGAASGIEDADRRLVAGGEGV